MKNKYLLSLLLLSNFTYAAIPTVEGLLRHGSNEEIISDTIVMRLKLEKKVESPLDFTAIKEDLTATIVSGEIVNNDKPIYMKLIFSKINKAPMKLLQILYNSSKMDETSLMNIKLIHNIERKVKKDTNVERQLLYSMIIMFGTNKSQNFSDLLSKINGDYKNNKEILDPEKKELFKKYKRYLQAIKEDKSLRDSLESPLNLLDRDENEKNKIISNRNMYTSNESVKLVRENGKFFWRVVLENFEGSFSNIKNQMLNFELNTPNGIIKSTITDYVLFDGTHELPKNIVIKDIIDSIYHLRILGYNTFNSTKKSIKTRYRDYLKLLDKSDAKNSPYSKDYFIY